MYRDLDVILSELKEDDWLASNSDIGATEGPNTSVATPIALQYVLEGAWSWERVANVHEDVVDTGVELVALTAAVIDAASDLRVTNDRVNAFDAVHLGSAQVLDKPIVATDTLFAVIDEVAHIDPRALG